MCKFLYNFLVRVRDPTFPKIRIVSLNPVFAVVKSSQLDEGYTDIFLKFFGSCRCSAACSP